jgi:hypothetical protein
MDLFSVSLIHYSFANDLSGRPKAMERRLIQFFGTKLSDAYTCAQANFKPAMGGQNYPIMINCLFRSHLKIIIKIDR